MSKNLFIISSIHLTGMQILQISTALPKKGHSTEEMIGLFPCALPEGVKQNIINLGVSKRYLVDQPDRDSGTETIMSEDELVGLCAEACERALQKAHMLREDVDYFVAAYDANPFLSPGLSQLLVPKLGLDPYVKHVNAQGTASTAFMKTLELAKDHLAAHPEDNVLLCISGVSSYWFQNQVRGFRDVMEIRQVDRVSDRAKRELELRKWVATMQFFLFGDGAAAAIVTGEDRGLTVKETVEVTNIGKKDYLAGYSRLSTLNEPFRFGFYSHLDKEIPKLGVAYTNLALKGLLGKNAGNMMKTARKWAVHTGSEKILRALAEHHGIEEEKLRESHEVLKECGNLAGASLPFILAKITSQSKLSEGDVVLMVGYGWGFSAAASLLEYRK